MQRNAFVTSSQQCREMFSLSLVDPPLHMWRDEIEKNDTQSGGQDLLPKQLIYSASHLAYPHTVRTVCKNHNTDHTFVADDEFRGQSDPTILSPFIPNMICVIFYLKLSNISPKCPPATAKRSQPLENSHHSFTPGWYKCITPNYLCMQTFTFN
jgi:hypothetical protein